jgi:hypothetical protein
MAPNLPRHVVVDGSNIATEGRSNPSLKQLDEAVRAFMNEHADHTVTVVVDATFGHRIDKSEVAAFDSAIDANELVCPPAGAIGRGDAFVLQIADKADAMILSNDSFQEFHGEYEWLFDEGRLMGGKPVPHVGWVFVLRSPVRGPTSRRVLRGVKKSGAAASKKRAGRPSPAASAPLPVPKSPPPGRRKSETSAAAAPAKPAASVDQKRKSADALNPLLAFVEFGAHHPSTRLWSPSRRTARTWFPTECGATCRCASSGSPRRGARARCSRSARVARSRSCRSRQDGAASTWRCPASNRRA